MAYQCMFVFYFFEIMKINCTKIISLIYYISVIGNNISMASFEIFQGPNNILAALKGVAAHSLKNTDVRYMRIFLSSKLKRCLILNVL